MSTVQAAVWATWRALHVLQMGAVLLAAVLLLVPVGALLERTLWPVVTDASVRDVTRDGQTLCWTLAYDKRRDVAPRAFVLSARGGRSPVVYSILAWHAADASAERGRIIRWAVGPVEARLCADLPPSMGPTASVTVESAMLYDVRSRPWPVLVHFPPVEWRAPR